jgi:callose synthase
LPFEKQEGQQYKLLYIGLYLLIWGEAANLRFMPECLCYIFHRVSQKFIYVYSFAEFGFFFFWPVKNTSVLSY